MKYVVLTCLSLIFIFSPLHAMQDIKVAPIAPAQVELKSPLSGSYVVVGEKEEIAPEIQASQESHFDELPFFNDAHISELLQAKNKDQEKKEAVVLPVYGPEQEKETQEPQASLPAGTINISDYVNDLIAQHKTQIGIILPVLVLYAAAKLYTKLTQPEW